MAHQSSHRRLPMDPKQHHHHHPLPDPILVPPPSATIQNISHRFSKLYDNHKKLLVSNSPHPQPDTDENFHSSCAILTKSSSQNERNGKTKVRDTERASFEEVKKKMVVLPGRRRSFCGSQVELAEFLSCNGVKVVAVDMPPFMQIHAVDCARKAHDSLEKFTSKTLAFTLKKEFDGVYGPAWQCIVGTSFGSFVTHSVGGFMYFSMDQKLYVLLFKTSVQKAE